jgi:hypothetical protein
MTEYEKRVFSRKEAAEYLGVCLPTLDHSDIPRVRVASRVLYRRSTLDKYLEENEGKEERCETRWKG